ncbi:AAA family ATPase [Salinilacihabitans rarus]|uniref:AAA family ATPase n=1 Tax=Salinilacihabitans rarus TaxID=2961596 RepID=UPI0020C87B3F|nr:AAA family ATPase [Salinilacihabitans rarus]
MSERTRLVVVCGLPGTGKTTVARTVGERLGATLLRTDVVRKDLFPEPLYADAETRATYDAVFERASDALDRGRPVVLDGTFRRAPLRRRARALAAGADAAFDLVRVTCAEDVVRERIAAREGDESDADFEVHRLLRAEFERPAIDHHVVDNSGTEAETRRQVESLL